MPEQKKIPILVLFSAWKPSEDLRPLLTDMLVTGAVIDRQQRCIQAEIQCAQCPDDVRRALLERELAAAYGVQRVTLRFQTPAAEPLPPPEPPKLPVSAERKPLPTDEAAPPEAVPPESEDPMEVFRRTERIRQAALKKIKPAAHTEKRGGREGPKEKLIYGRMVKKFPAIAMNDITLDSEMVTIEGDVFATDHLEMKKRGAWIVRFDITDQTNSIRVAKFLVGDEGKELAGAIREGQRLVVQGRVSPYQGEL